MTAKELSMIAKELSMIAKEAFLYMIRYPPDDMECYLRTMTLSLCSAEVEPIAVKLKRIRG